ncbi:hypothetical protein [Spongorhabdus nitratireducens]
MQYKKDRHLIHVFYCLLFFLLSEYSYATTASYSPIAEKAAKEYCSMIKMMPESQDMIWGLPLPHRTSQNLRVAPECLELFPYPEDEYTLPKRSNFERAGFFDIYRVHTLDGLPCDLKLIDESLLEGECTLNTELLDILRHVDAKFLVRPKGWYQHENITIIVTPGSDGDCYGANLMLKGIKSDSVFRLFARQLLECIVELNNYGWAHSTASLYDFIYFQSDARMRLGGLERAEIYPDPRTMSDSSIEILAIVSGLLDRLSLEVERLEPKTISFLSLLREVRAPLIVQHVRRAMKPGVILTPFAINLTIHNFDQIRIMAENKCVETLRAVNNEEARRPKPEMETLIRHPAMVGIDPTSKLKLDVFRLRDNE